MDLAFHLSVAPRPFHCSHDGALVAFNAGRKTAEFRDPGLPGAGQPSLQRNRTVIPEQLAELHGQMLGSSYLRVNMRACKVVGCRKLAA